MKAEPGPLAIKTELQPLVIKPEPMEDRIFNRKRSGTLSILRDVTPKKVKADPENPLIPETDVKPPPYANTETMRDELHNLQARINHLQPQLDRARRKSGKTAEQLTREKNMTNQLITLYQQKKALTEMIPAVSAFVQPVAGPSYQNGFTDGFAQLRQPLALVQTPVTSVPVASGSSIHLDSFKDEPMDTDSDSDDVAPPPTSDMDHFHSFGEGDQTLMPIDNVNFGAEFYHYNTAKADEWVHFLDSSPRPNVII
jgi:hypothetical protein